MDSMMGIFYEESSRLVEELKRNFSEYIGKDIYGQELIQEIFRAVHTIKADATMMLFDGIAALSKKFERLLYCFRNGPKVIEDTERFDGVFCGYVDFVEQELDKISHGEALENVPVGLIKLKFQNENENIRITVEDDGAGINSGKVIEAAQKAGVLKKKPEEYKKEEIMELLLVNGISTTDIPNDYSGRGVGMDVINHSIKEIGGKLNITSEEGFGTKIEIEV